jgi:hypothetical protein
MIGYDFALHQEQQLAGSGIRGDLVAPSSYRLIINNFRLIKQATPRSAGDDPTQLNPSEGGSACARNKNNKKQEQRV